VCAHFGFSVENENENELIEMINIIETVDFSSSGGEEGNGLEELTVINMFNKVMILILKDFQKNIYFSKDAEDLGEVGPELPDETVSDMKKVGKILKDLIDIKKYFVRYVSFFFFLNSFFFFLNIFFFFLNSFFFEIREEKEISVEVFFFF
jgi:hypothetical protein